MLRRSRLRQYAQIERKTSLRTRRPIRPRRRTPRRQVRVFDFDRRAWLREQRCCSPAPADYHRGPTDPHHTGDRGLGVKADDDTCIPLCRRCHEAWDGPDWSTSTGPFHGWTRERKRAWAAEQAEMWRARYEARADVSGDLVF